MGKPRLRGHGCSRPQVRRQGGAGVASWRRRALLDRADLITVSLQVEPGDLGGDCGDLILLLDSGPLLLLSEPRGYWWRDPASPQAAPRRLRPVDLAQRLQSPPPWNALGVAPSLRGQDTSVNALARFSYGPASHQAVVMVVAISLGLAIGLLLAIGKEVGAARWIAGLGGVGALLGAGMALLNDAFRPALFAALMGSLLGHS